MSKYIKLEDAINEDCILIDKIKCNDCPFYDEELFLCRIVEWLKSLPTIEVNEEATRPFEYFEGYEDGQASCKNCVWESCNYHKVDMDRVINYLWGEWVEFDNGSIACSICGTPRKQFRTEFCACCGADMRGRKNEVL